METAYIFYRGSMDQLGELVILLCHMCQEMEDCQLSECRGLCFSFICSHV